MDPAWRVKKQYGKGTRRLMLGFPRRATTDEKLGLRAGLRRYGMELPFRGPLACVLVGLFCVGGLWVLWQQVGPDSDASLILLDSPPQKARSAAANAEVAAEAQTPARPAKPDTAATPTRRLRLPQIGSLSELALAAPQPEVSLADRTPSRMRRPAQPDGSMPVLPAVSTRGPRRAAAAAMPARGASQVGRPAPAMASPPVTQTAGSSRLAPERIAVPSPQVAANAATRPTSVRGVPLASLASCLSDRREDALKQQLVARVAEPTICQSARGVYSFVETKNLNAFLMWIERAEDREAADRCTELSFAIECLGNAETEREARKS